MRILHSRRSAYTLIELVVVVAIIGLVLTITTIHVDDFVASSRLGSVARQIASTLALARNEAAAQGKAFGVLYDMDAQAFALVFPDEDGALPVDENDVREHAGGLHFLPKDVRMIDVAYGTQAATDGFVLARVSPMGVVSDHTIHLEQGKRQITLRVNQITGIVSVLEGYVEHIPPELQREE